MTDKHSNYDLNDELLSAYLDGELSADQRAAVEARLATNPTAQHLLHQLRSVSESVQALPQEKMGQRFSDAIIERIRVMRGSPDSVVHGSSDSVVRGSPDPAQPSDRRSPNTAEMETIGNVGRSAPNADPDDSPTRLANTISKVSIFHSKRSWIWASLALAAGLLIMVVQSGDDPAKKLPPVAQRSEPNLADQPAAEPSQRARRVPTLAPATSSPAPSAIAAESRAKEKADTFAGATPSEPMRDLSESAAGKPAGPESAAGNISLQKNRSDVSAQHDSIVASSPEKPSIDALANSPKPSGQMNSADASFGLTAGGGGAKPAAGDRKFIVVHVVATPEALKNKSFDRLLESSQIKFEAQPKSEPLSVAAADRYAIKQETENTVQRQESKNAPPPAEDLVLVEGSKSTIESFLSALNKDTNDYLRIDVDNGSQSHEATAASTATADKKITDNFSAYSRGAVPGQQKDSRAYYDYYEKLNQRAPDGSARRTLGGLETNGQAETFGKKVAEGTDQKTQSTQTRGRASRVDWDDLVGSDRALDETLQGGRAFRSANEPAKKLPELERKIDASARPAAGNDTIKVLFVLSPKEAIAPGAPPADQPK